MSNLLQPELLHTMQICILNHLQKWIFHLMKAHQRLDKYNALWFSVPAYHDLTPKTESYEDVTECSRNEMKENSRYQPGVVTRLCEEEAPLSVPYSIAQLTAHRHCQTSICMLDMNLMMMQHWATWKMRCVVVTASKIFSYFGEPAKRRRQTPIPWERSLWRSQRYPTKQILKLGCSPRSSRKWMPGGIISVTG